MAFQQHDPHYTQLSSIEVSSQLPRAGRVQQHLLPLLKGASFVLSRFRALMISPATNTPAMSCVDPAEAYLHACVAAAPFCYVSPAIYGLTGTIDERGVTGSSSQPGDKV